MYNCHIPHCAILRKQNSCHVQWFTIYAELFTSIVYKFVLVLDLVIHLFIHLLYPGQGHRVWGGNTPCQSFAGQHAHTYTLCHT